MLRLDEIESQFRSAEREPFALKWPEIHRVLVVTDLPAEDQVGWRQDVESFLEVAGDPEWSDAGDDAYDSVEGMLELVDERAPDLIVTYRNLKNRVWEYPFSLGSHLDVLTQKTPVPVLVMPNPHELPERSWRDRHTDRVMVVADHLAGDHSLVNWGVRMTRAGGTLYLTHVEDDAVFERYMQVISRIPEIDTDFARKAILEKLLRQARDYINSVRSVLGESDVDMGIEKIVTTGHRVVDYSHLVEEHDVDLLAFHTKDHEQLAMHGVAYSLCVELRERPLLMI